MSSRVKRIYGAGITSGIAVNLLLAFVHGPCFVMIPAAVAISFAIGFLWARVGVCQRPALVCLREVDMVLVHPQTDWSHKCETCGAKVGIFPSGQSIIRQHPIVKITCSRCAHGAEADSVMLPGIPEELEGVVRRRDQQ